MHLKLIWRFLLCYDRRSCLCVYPWRHECVYRSEGKVPRNLNLGTRWRWLVSFTSHCFTPRQKSRRYPYKYI